MGGNHDFGSTGISANLLADNSAPLFSGNLSGGDALSYFNDFYFPLNGPKGFGIQTAWNVDTPSATGFTFSYKGQTSTSPEAISAFRALTTVDTGTGAKAQIDHTSNYSFNYGTAHVLFLDANPHFCRLACRVLMAFTGESVPFVSGTIQCPAHPASTGSR